MVSFLPDKPCLVALSPMDDVTDHPFRQLCKSFGADVVVTEFIASEALNREAEKSRRKMVFDEPQRPLGIQVFGADESELLQCIEIVEEARPDFIDINWGCPVRKVAGRGAGSGMLREPDRLVSITASLVRHAHLPITVKTRLGYDESSKPIVELAERLQDVGVAALAIHGRTKAQMYKGVADWTLIGAVKNNPRMHIPVFGNGDLTTASEAVEAQRRYGVDGVLIGRAAIGNPWIFEQTQRLLQGLAERPITMAERVDVCRRHLLAEVDFKGEHSAIFEMRKHYGGYFKGIADFKQFRIPLVTVDTLEQVLPIFDRIVDHYSRLDG
ncbi:MAG: tRNA dihydrouridine synthase DusB [Bacteroidales bacterium]|nr:tRNA dihydrouridine synthase DusB [Bacteroidales bacterium]